MQRGHARHLYIFIYWTGNLRCVMPSAACLTCNDLATCNANGDMQGSCCCRHGVSWTCMGHASPRFCVLNLGPCCTLVHHGNGLTSGYRRNFGGWLLSHSYAAKGRAGLSMITVLVVCKMLSSSACLCADGGLKHTSFYVLRTRIGNVCKLMLFK